MSAMQTIIDPIEKGVLEKELKQIGVVRETNYGRNEIYIADNHSAPNIMKEIGRLREIAFRNAGGGTGKEADIDAYDTAATPYQQLIVWDSKEKEIIGGYRFIRCGDAEKDANGNYILATKSLFHFSEVFEKKYLPYTIELGRSFVQPKYQSAADARKGIFALDNIWDGLGAIVVDNPDMKYFFGKVTMYGSFNQKARDMILYILKKHFPDPENLIVPYKPLQIKTNVSELDKIFTGKTYEEDFKTLVKKVREQGVSIPPLFNIYMNLSSSMRSFGTVLNKNFGNVEETGILVTIEDIYQAKKERHILTYKKD